jgi:hypothetical protein
VKTFPLLLLAASLLAAPAFAQNWVAYVPAERDFRVLFPSQPTRSTAGDGSVVYRARFESGDHMIDYAVYRLPATVQRVSDEGQELRLRLQARLGDDVAVRSVREEDAGPAWERHVFRHRNATSVHRLVGAPGRYYELEVSMPGRGFVAVQTARDFFNSFQASGLRLPSLALEIGQRIETWCQSRTDPFTRAFCEYSVCLQPGFEQNPRCTSLFRR